MKEPGIYYIVWWADREGLPYVAVYAWRLSAILLLITWLPPLLKIFRHVTLPTFRFFLSTDYFLHQPIAPWQPSG